MVTVWIKDKADSSTLSVCVHAYAHTCATVCVCVSDCVRVCVTRDTETDIVLI